MIWTTTKLTVQCRYYFNIMPTMVWITAKLTVQCRYYFNIMPTMVWTTTKLTVQCRYYFNIVLKTYFGIGWPFSVFLQIQINLIFIKKCFLYLFLTQFYLYWLMSVMTVFLTNVCILYYFLIFLIKFNLS